MSPRPGERVRVTYEGVVAGGTSDAVLRMAADSGDIVGLRLGIFAKVEVVGPPEPRFIDHGLYYDASERVVFEYLADGDYLEALGTHERHPRAAFPRRFDLVRMVRA